MLDTVDPVNLDRPAIREAVLVELHRFRDQLSYVGYQQYRKSEWKHPETNRHVRIGYASDEWTIFVSKMRPRRSAMDSGLDPIGSIKLDTRLLRSGVPGHEELLERLQGL